MSSFFGLVSIFVVTQLFFVHGVSALNLTNEYLHHICFTEQGRYMKGSPYDKSLDRVFQLLSGGTFKSGFRDFSYGEEPNAIYSTIQCRGETNRSNCQSCFATAVAGLRRRCFGIKGGIIWYDQCLLRITTVDVFGKVDIKNKFYLSNPKKVDGNPMSFNKETSVFLKKLADKATSKNNVDGDRLVLYAAGEKNIGTKNLYAMVQCTQDIDFVGCAECLKPILGDFSKCCDGKVGGRVLSGGCNFRYEFYPFLRK